MTPLFVPILGGLGSSQLSLLYSTLVGVPGLNVWTPDDSQNQFTTNLLSAWALAPEAEMCAIGHSLACETLAHAAQSRVFRAVLIEPVWTDKDMKTCPTLWLESDALIDFPRAHVLGTNVTHRVIRGTNHNSICQATTAIDQIVAFVKGSVVNA